MDLAKTGQETQGGQQTGGMMQPQQPDVGTPRPGAMQLGITRGAMAGGAPPGVR